MRFKKIKTKTGRRPPVAHEERMQMALFSWVDLALRAPGMLGLGLLFAVPNGGKRDARTAGRLKAAGVRAGVPDLLLPAVRWGFVPSGGLRLIHGLALELKAGKGKPTERQGEWMGRLRREGWLCVVVWDDWALAREVLDGYLHGALACLAHGDWAEVRSAKDVRAGLNGRWSLEVRYGAERLAGGGA